MRNEQLSREWMEPEEKYGWKKKKIWRASLPIAPSGIAS